MGAVEFQIGDGGEFGGDYLWIEPKDSERHPEELRTLRVHLEGVISKLNAAANPPPIAPSNRNT